MGTDLHRTESGRDDVNATAVWVFGAAMLAAAIVLYVLLWQLFGVFSSREATTGAIRRYPVAPGEPRQPPEPRLQKNPRQDMQDFRAREDAILDGYGWVDPAAGIVRIPLEEAIRITAERGLPARPASPQSAEPLQPLTGPVSRSVGR